MSDCDESFTCGPAARAGTMQVLTPDLRPAIFTGLGPFVAMGSPLSDRIASRGARSGNLHMRDSPRAAKGSTRMGNRAVQQLSRLPWIDHRWSEPIEDASAAPEAVRPRWFRRRAHRARRATLPALTDVDPATGKEVGAMDTVERFQGDELYHVSLMPADNVGG